MTEAKDILENFGGHEMAGGFAIHKNNLEKLQEFLRSYPPAPFQRKGGEFRVGKDFEWTLTDKKRYKKLKELSIELRNNETKAEKFLENFGFTFLRFKNEEVLEDMEKVLKQIEDRLDKATFPLSFGKGSGDRIDFIDIDIKDINRKLFDEISIFAPFGTGNEKIIFKIKLKEDDKLNVKRFGKQNEHLEILINGIRGIDFFANKNREEELKNKKEFLINLEWDNFRGDIVMKFVK